MIQQTIPSIWYTLSKENRLVIGRGHAVFLTVFFSSVRGRGGGRFVLTVFQALSVRQRKYFLLTKETKIDELYISFLYKDHFFGHNFGSITNFEKLK